MAEFCVSTRAYKTVRYGDTGSSDFLKTRHLDACVRRAIALRARRPNESAPLILQHRRSLDLVIVREGKLGSEMGLVRCANHRCALRCEDFFGLADGDVQ